MAATFFFPLALSQKPGILMPRILRSFVHRETHANRFSGKKKQGFLPLNIKRANDCPMLKKFSGRST